MEAWSWVYALGLLALGFALMAADVLIAPALDILGLFGVVALLGSVYYAYAALGPLRPGGPTRFGPRRVDAVTEGDYIDVGAPVEVIAVQASRVVVRPSR